MKQKFRLFLLFTVFCFFITLSVSYLSLPEEIYVIEGKDYSFNYKNPILTNVSSEKTIKTSSSFNYNNPLTINAQKEGNYKLNFDFFGLFSVKEAKLKVLEDTKVYPSGQSTGVKILTDGVLVVAIGPISDTAGNNICPARDAGLLSGDFLLAINGNPLENKSQLINFVKQNKSTPFKLTYKRDDKEYETTINPIYTTGENYALGMWVRDSTAGLGTLTFYTGDKGRFAALGHSITDVDTGKIMPISEGDLVKSSIISTKKGQKGIPGELVGVFNEPICNVGTIKINNQFGLYGEVSDKSIVPEIQPIPLGLKNEVKEGKAQILTTLDNDTVESFEVEIIKINNQQEEHIKSMVIKVTDPDLIAKTGGIVQGMSGSPIIQNGKLIGAVTHVFVNDPLKGYGVFIEWMVDQMEDF